MKLICHLFLTLAAFALLTTAESLRAQTSPADNPVETIVKKPIYRNVYGEIFGASDVIGVNYDQRFKSGSHWGFRAGMGYGFFSDTGFIGVPAKNSISFPLAVNAIFGKKHNFFEAGFGYASIIGFDRYHYYVHPDGSVELDHPYRKETVTSYFSKIFLDLGYRYHRPNGFMLRAGLSPCIVGQFPFCLLRVSPYLAMGYTF